MTTLINVSCDFCQQSFLRQKTSVDRIKLSNAGKYKCIHCCRKLKTAFKGTPIHNSYAGAKQRCQYPKHKHYQYYGGRGIRFLWGSFDEFYADMAPTYFESATIERVDVNGDYCKSNCRWVSAAEQSRNTTRNIHTADAITEIRKLYSRGVTQVELAKRYGDSQGNISNIIRARTWKNV